MHEAALFKLERNFKLGNAASVEIFCLWRSTCEEKEVDTVRTIYSFLHIRPFPVLMLVLSQVNFNTVLKTYEYTKLTLLCILHTIAKYSHKSFHTFLRLIYSFEHFFDAHVPLNTFLTLLQFCNFLPKRSLLYTDGVCNKTQEGCSNKSLLLGL